MPLSTAAVDSGHPHPRQRDLRLHGGLLHHHRRADPAPHGQTDGGMARHSAATAVMLMLLASVFDLFDGLVARKLRSSAMGAELDNLSDLISFGLAPAYFVVVWGMVADDAPPAGLGGGRDRGAARGGAAAGAVLLHDAARTASSRACRVPFGALTVVSIVLLELPFVPTLAGHHRGGVADGEPGRVPQAARPPRRRHAVLDRRQHGLPRRLGRSTPPAGSCCSRPVPRSRS